MLINAEITTLGRHLENVAAYELRCMASELMSDPNQSPRYRCLVLREAVPLVWSEWQREAHLAGMREEFARAMLTPEEYADKPGYTFHDGADCFALNVCRTLKIRAFDMTPL